VSVACTAFSNIHALGRPTVQQCLASSEKAALPYCACTVCAWSLLPSCHFCILSSPQAWGDKKSYSRCRPIRKHTVMSERAFRNTEIFMYEYIITYPLWHTMCTVKMFIPMQEFLDMMLYSFNGCLVSSLIFH